VTDAGIACRDIQDRVLGQSICELLDEMGADTFVVWDTPTTRRPRSVAA